MTSKFDDGQLSLGFLAAVTVGDNKEISVKLDYDGHETSVLLTLRDDKRECWIEVLGNGEFSAGFTVTYTLPSSGNTPEPGAPVPVDATS